jgi:hypothetical protein
MRLSPAQKRFVTALFERLHRETATSALSDARTEEPDLTPDDVVCTSPLRNLDRTAFFQTVERAARDAETSAKTARQLTFWAVRLAPYLERDAAMSLQEAQDAYLRDTRARRAASTANR